MTFQLPDVNVLVALGWPNHVHHTVAREWFAGAREAGWATTPVTELGFVRVSSNRTALPAASSPAEAITQLRAMKAIGKHTFWVDSVADVTGDFDVGVLTGHRQTTDAHLVAIAKSNGGTIVTLDRGLLAFGQTHVRLLTADKD